MPIIGGSVFWFGSENWQKGLDPKQTIERHRSSWKAVKSWNYQRKSAWVKDSRLEGKFKKIDILSLRNAANLPLNPDDFWASQNKEIKIDAKTQSCGFF